MAVSIRLVGKGGKSMLVDEVDADLVAMRWSPTGGNGRGGEYAATRKRLGKRRITVYAHRVIVERMLGVPLRRGHRIDHVNFDGFDNRRSNLRMVTHAQNIQNRSGPAKTSTSGHRGVSWWSRDKKWVAQVHHMGKRYFFGYHKNIEDAARAAAAGRRSLGFLGS